MQDMAAEQRSQVWERDEAECSGGAELLTFHQIDRLMWRVLKFIWQQTDRNKPTLYNIQNLGYIQERLIPALVEGRYVFKPGYYFASYQVENGRIEVQEAACAPGNMKDMIRALRGKAQFTSACWHRVKSGWKRFPRQQSNHS